MEGATPSRTAARRADDRRVDAALVLVSDPLPALAIRGPGRGRDAGAAAPSRRRANSGAARSLVAAPRGSRDARDALLTRHRSRAAARRSPPTVEITFEQGVPVAVNGIAMPFVEIVEVVETIAGDHGVGRIDMVENRSPGVKSREITRRPRPSTLGLALARSSGRRSRATASAEGSSAWTYADSSTTASGSRRRARRSTRSSATSSDGHGIVRLKLFQGDCRVGRDADVPLSGTGARHPSEAGLERLDPQPQLNPRRGSSNVQPLVRPLRQRARR